MNREEVLNAVAEMSVLELSELIKDMEEKFGVSASAAVAVAAPAAGGAERHAVGARSHLEGGGRREGAPRVRWSSPSYSPPP